MAALQQPIRVRLQHDILASVDAVQYDTYREFHFIIDDYEIPEDITDIRIFIEKPSGNSLYNFGKLINGEVVYQPTPQTLAEVGTSKGQVQLIKNNAVLTSFPFNIEVQKNLVDDDGFTSGKEFLIYDELVKSMQQHDLEIQKTNEQIKEQEAARVEVEKSRVAAENDRVSAENVRVKADKARDDAENLRKSQETTRQNQEADRVKKDQEREAAETTRKSNESARQTAEDNRESNESSRQTAEQKRVEAEIKRESDCKTAIKNCDDAVSRVDQTIQEVNEWKDNVVNDNVVSDLGTYSSTKIMTLFENQTIASVSEPEEQHVGALWFVVEEDTTTASEG
ncbi:MAG TPA: hypothetical protein DCW90_24935 [Lachnospiraceae bacterium]|nr:hypothetical protein [Lachnospiraceae bacterium]